MKKVKEYNHSNQTLLFDDEVATYQLISYSTMVLEIVNGSITFNQHGKISTTTSKHITQARSFLGI